ncbi:MAG TPA: DUF1326 domain-containing protein [Pyrinomonadaceae bacterium]|jgi:hypothetical protein|nr:DUF1326 domain-containing protein [Pyrinomonadaceae bacterium]
MRKLLFFGLLVVAFGAVLISTSAEAGKNVAGDYVEARTASVFAGACHFNGEVVTTGREAIMAWNISSGEWNGTDLAGVRAMAVVSSSNNLAQPGKHKSEIVVDEKATTAQAAALGEMLRAKYGASLGEVIGVSRKAISFRHEAKAYQVDAPGFAALSVEAMPNDDCCKMPGLVWYSPLVPLANRKVGYTAKAYYAGGTAGDKWQRENENSAFYGSFAF